ncbi:MAG: hypothetical protein R2792_16995 [Saprospiraceae bacterium]
MISSLLLHPIIASNYMAANDFIWDQLNAAKIRMEKAGSSDANNSLRSQ